MDRTATDISRITFRVIDTRSRFYQGECALRDRVLRKPLGMTLSEQDTAGEDQQVHIVAMDGGNVVGCVLGAPLQGGHLKLRQMAIAPEWQGIGLGRQLVARLESWAKLRAYHMITAHAREVAHRFYLKLGYTIEGGLFTEVGLPHYRILKKID